MRPGEDDPAPSLSDAPGPGVRAVTPSGSASATPVPCGDSPLAGTSAECAVQQDNSFGTQLISQHLKLNTIRFKLQCG